MNDTVNRIRRAEPGPVATISASDVHCTIVTQEETARMLWNELCDRASQYADRVAIATPEDHATFSRLLSLSEELAERLSREGVKRGDVVGLCLPNKVEFVVAYLALCRLEAVVALVSTKYRTTELQAIIHGVGPDFFVTARQVAIGLAAAIPESEANPWVSLNERASIVLVKSLAGPGHGRTGPLWEDAGQPGRKPSLIKFTAGSTGEPKGILLSAANVVAEANSVVSGLSLTPDDCILSAVPAFHSYGFDLGVLGSLFSGARLELRETFVPRQILSELARSRVSVFLGVPSMYRFFLDVRLDSPPNLASIRYPLSCTAPLDPAVVDAFHRTFGAAICQHYGSSESGAATTHVPGQVLARKDSVGQAMPNVRVKVVGAGGQSLPSGESGEVVVSGPAVALGYIMGCPPEGSPIKNGEYWTGDIGHLDEAGFLYVSGRLSQLINVGGMKVSPVEVTRVLESCPAVQEAAVIGARDGNGDEVVYAVVTLKSPADEGQLLAHCRGILADYKIPRRIDIRDEMPRSAAGKIRIRPEDVTI